MPPRFSIWMVLAGVAVGVIAGYLTGSGLIGEPLFSTKKKTSEVAQVRAEMAKLVSAERRVEFLRAFDEAARRVKARRP